MADLKEVKQLRKTESKHDIQFKGRVFHLEIQPCEHGVWVTYVEKVPIEDLVPDFMRSLIHTSGKTQKRSVHQEHVFLSWWEKCLGMKLKNKVSKCVSKVKKDMKHRLSIEKRTEDIQEWLEQN